MAPTVLATVQQMWVLVERDGLWSKLWSELQLKFQAELEEEWENEKEKLMANDFCPLPAPYLPVLHQVFQRLLVDFPTVVP